MKTKMIYENLDTSFVNLGALVRFLQRRNFIGRLRLEMKDYEAEIAFDDFSQIRVQEFDRASGRVSGGEDAFQRLLVRSREAGGKICVYQLHVEVVEQPAEKPLVQVQTNGTNGHHAKTPTYNAPHSYQNPQARLNQILPHDKTAELKPLNVEANFKSSVAPQTPDEWQEVLLLSRELLKAMEKAVFILRLDPVPFFREAQIELADDYQFLDPSRGKFMYSADEFIFTERPPINAFILGFTNCLRRTINKIQSRPNTLSLRPTLALNFNEVLQNNRAAMEKLGFLLHIERLIYSLR